MQLNSSNYYSREADMEYMSASQFKAFHRCEAAAIAELNRTTPREESTALLVGSYVDAHFDGTLDIFKAQHPEILKRDGTLKMEYIKAEELINRMENDELFRILLGGAKQVIVTGEISGVPYKGKIDVLLGEKECTELLERFPETQKVVGFGDGMIVDLKCMKDMRKLWDEDEQQYVPFPKYWGYDFQGAIYQKLEGHSLPFVLAVGTKESTPNIEAINIPGDDLDDAFDIVVEMSPRYAAIKRGEIEPVRCGRCPYCIATKKLDCIIDWSELDG